MKTLTFILSVFVSLHLVSAQNAPVRMAMSAGGQTVLFQPNPLADAKDGAYIAGRTAAGEMYGFAFKGVPAATPIIEFLDKGGKTLKALTVADLFGGKATATVKPVPLSVAGTKNRSVAAYDVTMPQGKSRVEIHSTMTDGAAAGKLILKVGITGPLASSAFLRLTLPFTGQVDAKQKGFVMSTADGRAGLSGSVLSPVEKISVANRRLSVTVKVEGAGEQKNAFLASFDAAPSRTEADALVKKFETDNTNDIVIVNTSDRETAEPNDTVTYRIHCINIGKGPVADVVVSNAISSGTRFLEGSAAGADAQVTLDRQPAAAPQVGAVTSVSWKLNGTILPGDERTVEFKVIVQ
ncbi:MAG: DUF11 domain-containing protein [Bacteroidetes bacterium]|nr:MAG: DUF11 domain-containing protein [Bacteroidota bacterium]